MARSRRYHNKSEQELIAADGRPLEPPRPSDIEGRPAVGEDALLAKLIKEHPEKDPANTKMEQDE